MNNTLTSLNNYLFEQIERIQDDELSGEDLDKELKRSAAICDVAGKIIDNADLQLKVMKHVDEYYGSFKGSNEEVCKQLIGGETK